MGLGENFLLFGIIMENNIYLRVKMLCEQHNLTVPKLESILGFGKTTIKKWEDSSPSADKIIKVANYFGVSTDYLLGVTDIQSPINDFLGDKDIVSFQRAREKMSESDRNRMMQLLKIGFVQAFSEDDDDK